MRLGQRFVALRSIDNQAAVMHHRIREQLVGQRTALLNALRGHRTIAVSSIKVRESQ
jgi:transposase